MCIGDGAARYQNTDVKYLCYSSPSNFSLELTNYHKPTTRWHLR